MDNFSQSNMNEDQNYVPQGYTTYASDDDHGYALSYPQPPGMVNYPVHPGAAPRGLHLVSCTSL